MSNLNVRIYNKFDTYENWMASDLVLGAGEIAVASIPSGDNTGLTPPAVGIKVGDGAKTFAQLSWIQATAGDVYDWAKAATKPEYKADEITGLTEFVEGLSDIDTNTEYSFEIADNYKIKVQKKDIGGEYADYQTVDLTSAFNAKADKVAGAVEGNFAGLDANGNLTDSGKKASDFATAGHDHNAQYAAKAATEAHIADADIHVTAEKKAAWDQAITDLAGTESKASQALANAATAQGDVDAIKADYLKASDKKELTDADAAQVERIATLEGQIVGLSGAMHFKGIVEVDPTTITEGYANGDTVIFGNKEFVWNNGAFVEYGDVSAVGERVGTLESEMDAVEGRATALEAKAHEHANKEVIDSITAEKVAAWDGAESNVIETISGVTTEVTEKDVKITGVSSDLLTQGTNTLVFNCGTASTVI